MAAFLLVHGAWHGGWCWRRVTPLLRAAGHVVFTPTLTGLGERSHLLTPEVDLATHIEDVIRVIQYEDLEDVTLVGHSYGGMVISGVADRLPERMEHLVYLDAFVPENGQSVEDLNTSDSWARIAGSAMSEGAGWRIPPSQAEKPFGIEDETDAAWVRSKLGDHPLRALRSPVKLVNPAAERIPRTYIRCVGSSVAPRQLRGVMGRFAEEARSNPRWIYRELPTGHDAMVTMPHELADMLVEVTDAARAQEALKGPI